MTAADCDRWENRLLELVYEELAEPDEREVRAHLDGCEHCRTSLQKLSRGRMLARQLPQAEPPALAMQVVLRAARDKALETAAARAAAAKAVANRVEAERQEVAAVEPTRPRQSWWTSVLAVVMSPQFAMATLLVLTVGVGLYWFPNPGDNRSSAPRLVSEPDTVATGPEALTPAEPLRFDVDPRTGRVAAHLEEGANVEDGETPAADRLAAAETERREPRLIPADEGRHEPEAEATEASSAAAIATLMDGTSAGTVVDGVLPSPLAPAADLGMATGSGSTPGSTGLGSTGLGSTGLGSTGLGSTGLGSTGVGSSAGSAGGATRAPGTGERTRPESGSYRELDSPATEAPRDEVDAVTPDGATLVASALLGQARELARAGRDREAIAQYESMLARFRTAPEAPQAMIEVAELYRRTGALGRSRAWLERAATHASVAGAARREMLRLDAAERAIDDTAGAEAAPSGAPAAAAER